MTVHLVIESMWYDGPQALIKVFGDRQKAIEYTNQQLAKNGQYDLWLPNGEDRWILQASGIGIAIEEKEVQ